MRCTHIFTLANVEASCSLISTELKNTDFVRNSQQVAVKDFGDAKNMKFCCLPKGWDDGWHNSPVKQFVIGVSGAIQITCRDTSQVTVSTGGSRIIRRFDGKRPSYWSNFQRKLERCIGKNLNKISSKLLSVKLEKLILVGL